MVPNDQYLQATTFLSSIDSDWKHLVNLVGPCRHQSKPAREPYEALVRAVAYQQLHAKAGDAILKRLLDLYTSNFPTPEELLSTEFEVFRSCGFSARKVETIQGIATATISGQVPSREIADTLSDEALIERLVALKGIGRWTVEMLLIYTLDRNDILPIDDFGVREGYRKLKQLTVAPTPKVMSAIAQSWSPHRTVAAWYLWRVTDTIWQA